MIHRARKRKLGRSSSARKSLLLNLTRSIFEHGQIKTTLAKAKEVRPFAEKIITIAKDDSVNNRRKITALFQSKSFVQKIFSEIGPRSKDRNGGYLRIMKYGFRNGDKSPVAIIELVDRKDDVEVKKSNLSKKEKDNNIIEGKESKDVVKKISVNNTDNKQVTSKNTNHKEAIPTKDINSKKTTPKDD